MSSALMKIDPAVLAFILRLPDDCEVEVAPENESGAICLIVNHDSIPDDAAEVVGIMRRKFDQSVFDRFEVTARV